MSRHVLVTGARGFIGRHAARSLAALGCTVIGIGHGSWTTGEAREFGVHHWIEADITLDALNRLELPGSVDCVLHCAGSGAVSYSYAQPWQDFQRATVTTAAVLEWIRNRFEPKPRLVLVSSAAVYGDQGDTDAMETSVRSPISPYGFHKLAAETLCESSSRFFDVPVSIVRFFSVYGEGLRKQLLWDGLNKFRSGQSQFFGTGNELRDWIHIEDAAGLLSAVACAEQGNFEVYNGGGNKATTLHVLTTLAGCAHSGLRPTFTGQTHTGNPRRLTSDSSHAKRQLGWSASVPLADGLERYARWFESETI